MSRKNKLLSEREISYFCQQINMIIKAGLPTYYGISILRDSTTDVETQKFLSKIYDSMEHGISLHKALSETGVFPKYMLHMIGKAIKDMVVRNTMKVLKV